MSNGHKKDKEFYENLCKAPECTPVCKLDWELKEASRHIEYMRGRVKENPMMVPLVGGMHGGTIDWDRQQPFVEKMLNDNPYDLADRDFVVKRIKGAQNYNQRTEATVAAMKCYIDNCGPDGKRCIEGSDKQLWQDEFIGCAWKVPHVGKKTIDLMKEYFGDDDAVAIDRHVGHWVCKEAGVACPIVEVTRYNIDGKLYDTPTIYDFTTKRRRRGKPERVLVPFDFVKGGTVPDGVYNELRDGLRRKARECGLEPAHLQVGAWIKGACDAKVKRMRKGKSKIFIGRDYTMDCGKRETPRYRTFDDMEGN